MALMVLMLLTWGLRCVWRRGLMVVVLSIRGHANQDSDECKSKIESASNHLQVDLVVDDHETCHSNHE